MFKNLELFCQNFSRETGISFPPSRYGFVQNKLSPLLEKYNCHDLSELIQVAKYDLKLQMDITNTLTTNETWFFRHPEQFEILKNSLLPELVQRKKDKVINIWSAGCSIGAELYSILITILEAIPESSNFRLNILGSDISCDAINIAKKGIYAPRDLRATDRQIIQKYFVQLDDNSYQIKDELKSKACFECLNLIDNWPPRTFDIIFCRNTMIYFNESSKKIVLEKFFKALDFNGYFLTSANEQIDIDEEKLGIKKLYLKNEMVYKKLNCFSNKSELFFYTPSDLLKATNFLRRNSYDFQFGESVTYENGTKIRSIIVQQSDCNKIIENLLFNFIEIKKITNIK